VPVNILLGLRGEEMSNKSLVFIENTITNLCHDIGYGFDTKITNEMANEKVQLIMQLITGYGESRYVSGWDAYESSLMDRMVAEVRE
jgi:hypothetical protein